MLKSNEVPSQSAGKTALAGAAIMVAACVLIAATTLMAKILGRGVIGAELHPLQISAGRFFFGFACIGLFSIWKRPSFQGTRWGLHAGRSIVGWAGVSCLFAAATYLPLADATAISFLSPLLGMIIAIPVLGERVGPWRWGAAVVAMAGAMILIQPGTEAFKAAALIAFAAACLMGLEMVLIKQLTGREPAQRILLINNAIGAVIAVGAAAFVWTPPSLHQWLMMALLGVTMVAAQALFIGALQRAEASFAMPFFYSTLVFAAAFDFAIFGTVPEWTSWVGAVLIIGGALVLAWRESRLASGARRRSTS
jgi:drug/metabolite transporter (DMT)-like permease